MGYLDLVLGLALVGLGIWGYRGAASLASDVSDTDARGKKERGIRRGAILAIIIGALFVVGSVLRAIFPPTG